MTEDSTLPYTYTAAKPPLPETPEQLRARIPGWGVDLDPADRPSVPRLQPWPGLDVQREAFPERQPGGEARERSIEHAFVTPVFGTAVPLKGLSGALRRYAYVRHSEAKAMHWLVLLAADRVDVVESRVTSLLHGRPDRMVHELGLRAELTHGGVRSRVGRGRVDVNHQWVDPLVVASPWIAAGLAYRALRKRRGR